MEWTRFVAEVLPALLGLVLCAYVILRIYGRKAQFLKIARGQVLTTVTAALIVLWMSSLARSSMGSAFEDLTLAVGTVFVVLTAWISTVIVSLVALYPNLGSAGELLAWFRRNPLNFVSVWGMLGLAMLVVWLLWSAFQSEPLSDTDPILIPVTAYLLASIAFDIAAPMVATRRGRLKRLTKAGMISMMLLAIAWMGMPSAQLALDTIPRMALGFDGINPYSWLILILFGIIARSVQSAGFLGLVVSPEMETMTREGFRPFDIPRGIYLICDSKPDQAFSLFTELCTLPLRPDAEVPSPEASPRATLQFLIPKGLVITREFPDKVRQAYNLQVTPIIWLTESPGERRIAPTSLTVLADTITRFMEANPNSIVLLEGVEYLATHNDFRKVLRQLDSLSETTWLSRARLLVTVDPNAFDSKDRALLERDRTVVDGADGIRELKRESMVEAALK